jgi:hypothetical protein
MLAVSQKEKRAWIGKYRYIRKKTDKMPKKDLTKAEERVIDGLRRIAVDVQHGSFEVKFIVHDRQLQSGEASERKVRL